MRLSSTRNSTPDEGVDSEGDRRIAFSVPHEVMPGDRAVAVARNISKALKRAANRSRAPVSIVTGGAHASRPGDRLLRKGITASFALVFILPLLLASIYWGLIASQQYVTEAKFSLQLADSAPFQTLGVSGQDEKQIQDSQVVVKFILGRSMVEALDRSIDLRVRFAQGDYFSRFDPGDPIEALEKYWKKRVDASVDLMSGIISLHVRAFSPANSLLITQKIVELSEKLVNDMSTRTRRDALAQTQAELSRAEARMKTAAAAMRDARNIEGVLDAPSAAEAINKVLTQLRLELATTESNLDALRGSAPMQDSPQIRLLAARAESLKKQILEYSGEIASKENKRALATRASALSAPEVDLKFAEQQYSSVAAAYETARIDLERQRAYLSLFLRPTLAQKAIYPRRLLEWFIIVGPALLIWAALVGVALLARDNMAK